ncbi:MAG TPA: pyrimidine/purine nucleoside phosphorylase [Planctomycetota bacterium]|nr:pyrimidine/purine nucleoside phosphorylase [Planctomycetota bacterium]
MANPAQFDHVTLVCKANIYFEGGVISHTILFPDGSKKTIGTIRQGDYKFNTDAPELMQIVAGACRVKLAGAADWTPHATGTEFQVPGKSSFEISVDSGIAEYVCSFLAA